LTIDNDKAVKWLAEGAQPTERVAKLLKISGAAEQFEAAKASK
jgi:small subunit ribosomal protein S16